MRKLIALVLSLAVFMQFSLAAVDAKSVKVKGYTTKKGKIVQPYYKTAPNKTKLDNYSTKGNVNPYSGKVGKKKLK